MPPLRKTEHPVWMSKEFGKLSKFGTSSSGKHEKDGDMYVLKWTDKNETDIQKEIEQVLGPLSLFAPFSHENVTVPAVDRIQLERPVTPIDEEIKEQPRTLDKVALLIRRRVMPKPDVPYLSLEDQKNLAAIIMGEVSGIWPDIKRQIDDPLLTPSENKELHRRIAVYIVTSCDWLFHHYLDKAQVLNRRGVFSGPANMSRLKVQLALETSELLNILKIRRHIVADIRKSARQNEPARISPRSATSTKTLSSKDELDSRYLRSKHQRLTMIDQEIKEIQGNMPVLDTSQLMEFVANLPERSFHSPSEAGVPMRLSHLSQGKSCLSGVSKEDKAEQKISFKRSYSQPLIEQGSNLLEELGISSSVKVDKLFDQDLHVLQREKAEMARAESARESKLQLGSQIFLENDLKMLTEPRKGEFLDGKYEDDLPALLQAIIRHARHDDLKQRMEKKLAELKDIQEKREEEECIYIRDPTYQQPDTVSANLGNAGVVQTSDIRVSDRVCMTTMTLKRQAPVYNELLDEIDQSSTKEMDTNLLLNDEIQEVYREVMKTVPTNHLELDDDSFIMNAPDFVDITGTLASATLSRQVMDRIINPVFRKDRQPLQKNVEMKEMTGLSSMSPMKIKGNNSYAVTKDISRHGAYRSSFGQMLQNNKISSTQASQMLQKMPAMSAEDYMNYLSSLETDFLGALFHLYDSDEDEDSWDDGKSTKLNPFSRAHLKMKTKISPEEKEKLQKIEELKKLKTEYKVGFWNANSVLLGGLGKDPELSDEPSQGKITGEKALSSGKPTHSVRKSQEGSGHVAVTSEKRDCSSTVSKTATQVTEPSSCEDKKPQDRLESIWDQLQMPDNQRLDMAIKYSCNDYFSKLSEAVEKWELITDLILKREGLLAKLEKFERQASDPNRFFAKDSKNSTYRLEESRQRAYIYKQIDAFDTSIKSEVDYIKDHFKDVITFKGRPYIDKMKWDRTEMLYWLSEERKQNGLEYETIIRRLNQPYRPALLQSVTYLKPPE